LLASFPEKYRGKIASTGKPNYRTLYHKFPHHSAIEEDRKEGGKALLKKEIALRKELSIN
jgi:hypothetical protein